MLEKFRYRVETPSKKKKRKKPKEPTPIQRPDLSVLLTLLPPLVPRNYKRMREYCNISGRTLANLDSQGLGCPERILLGNTTAYPREAFVSWLEQRSKVL